MRLYNTFTVILLSLLYAGCGSQVKPKQSDELQQQPTLKLGNIEQCQQYTGLPENWGSSTNAGMVWIPQGQVALGSNLAYADERNFGEAQRPSGGFWMDQTEVTVAQFASFVKATGYVTDAEQQKQAAVFSPVPTQTEQWWSLRSDYTWKTPNGQQGAAPAPHEAVRYVTKNDAEHYAVWLGHDLPTEIEWEYAAKAGSTQDTPLHQAPTHHQQPAANYWQGEFPFENTQQDHFAGVAPVGCYATNSFGLYDMIGNVWEWTSSPYQGAHDQHMGDYQSLRKTQTQSQVFVLKGGSFLCASNYCARFRNSSRYPQEFDLAATHVGFRTIYRPQ